MILFSIIISNVKVLSRVKSQLNNGAIAAIDLAQMVDPRCIEIEKMTTTNDENLFIFSF